MNVILGHLLDRIKPILFTELSIARRGIAETDPQWCNAMYESIKFEIFVM